jgi:hypothetical protein
MSDGMRFYGFASIVIMVKEEVKKKNLRHLSITKTVLPARGV